MKNLLTTTFLVFFLVFLVSSSSYAKVLPIIEGSELLDTLASQNNEELNMPSLTAGVYKYVDLEHMIVPQGNFLKEQLNSMDIWSHSFSFMNESENSILYLKPDNELIFTQQICTKF